MVIAKNVRQILKILASAGIFALINNVVKTTMPENSNMVSKVLTFVGAYILAEVINEKGNDVVDKTCNQIESIGEKYEC